MLGRLDAETIVDETLFKATRPDSISLGPDGLVENFKIVNEVKVKVQVLIFNSVASSFLTDGNFLFNASLICSDPDFSSRYIQEPTAENAVSISNTRDENNLWVSDISCQLSQQDITQVSLFYTLKDTDSKIKEYFDRVPELNVRIYRV